MQPKSNRTAISTEKLPQPAKKRGRKPRPIVEFPEPISTIWVDPVDFSDALTLHMKRHGDSANHLHRAIKGPKDIFD